MTYNQNANAVAESFEVDMAPRQSLTTYIFNTLKKAILDGKLAEGRCLTQQELCEKFGASLTPVREALLKLSALGLVDIEPNRKASVAAAPDDVEMADLYLIRMQIEARALTVFTTTFPAAQKQRLRERFKAMKEAAAASDIPAYVEHDIAFHDFIYAGTGMKTMYGIWQVIAAKLHLTIARVGRRLSKKQMQVLVGYHKELLDAILAGDAEKAVDLNTRHLYASGFEVRPDLVELFGRQNRLFKQCLEALEQVSEEG